MLHVKYARHYKWLFATYSKLYLFICVIVCTAGRTGRGGATGIAHTFFTQLDKTHAGTIAHSFRNTDLLTTRVNACVIGWFWLCVHSCF